jgi:putative endonuclease
LEIYYAGSTSNVDKRVIQHNTGRGKFTSKGVPWVLVIKIECQSGSEAIQLELRIKKRGIKRYLQENHLV